jgi:hypothetical protein
MRSTFTSLALKGNLETKDEVRQLSRRPAKKHVVKLNKKSEKKQRHHSKEKLAVDPSLVDFNGPLNLNIHTSSSQSTNSQASFDSNVPREVKFKKQEHKFRIEEIFRSLNKL